MRYNPGEIYLIRERTSGRDDFTSLVKIGLVRNKDGRNSYDRLKEHQTGNPRLLSLTDEYIVHTDAVDHVEAQLHSRFAEKRVRGEWFQIDSKNDLKQITSTAEALAEEMSDNRPLFSRAETLKKIPDNGETISTTAESEGYATAMAVAKRKLTICKELQDKIKQGLITAIASGTDVRGAAKQQTRTLKPKFDKKHFKDSHPNLYTEFLLESPSWYHRFLLDSKFKKTNSLEMPLVEEFLTEKIDIESLTENAISKGEAHLLNEPVLRLTHLQAIVDWEEAVSEAQLMVACDKNLAIDSLCKWRRYNKVTEIFDEVAFSKQYPELYFDYLTDSETNTYIRLTKTRNS